MKLLVVAQTPPPVHGQSLAVAALLQHLRAQPDCEVHHVNLSLSRDARDIGRWRPGKMLATLRAARMALRILEQHGPMPLYYVPAPGKRGALYRDWAILGLARPRASALILHWHAVGLGAWLETRATAPERAVTQRLLGRADLAIVQAESCCSDAAVLRPQRTIVVPNGVEDPPHPPAPKASFSSPCHVVFLGLGCREKGLFDALDGVALANARHPGRFRFTAVGPFARPADAAVFNDRLRPLGRTARHAGFVSTAERDAILRDADIFCFPSYYPHEGQPAVLLEALACDLPIVATRWRGIPDNLPPRHVHLVEPRSPEQIAAALDAAWAEGPPGGRSRAHYLAHFTRERHLRAVTNTLRQVWDGSILP